MLRLRVDPEDPDATSIARVVSVLKAGGLVALPTDTLYGLAVNPFDADAVERVFLVKGRAAEKALPLIASDMSQIVRIFGPWTGVGGTLAEKFWPGPLTILIPAPSALGAVSGGTGRVGVRVPAHPVARRVCAASGSVLTATSANLTGEPASNDPDHVAAMLGAHIDMIVDAGKTGGGLPSTIVDVASAEPRLVRAGAIPWEHILQCLK